MYKGRAADGKRNICGRKVKSLRKQMLPKVSQNGLAKRMQLGGLDVDKCAIQRIESGERLITDIELRAFADVFQVPIQELFEEDSSSAPEQ